jgi:glycosyltransferase involved in cell wall biosynthesis
MQKLHTDQLHYQILQSVYKIAPFDLKGDLQFNLEKENDIISCLVIVSRFEGLRHLLEDLSYQTIAKDKFEVIVLNDGAGDSIKEVTESFKNSLNICYRENSIPHRVLSNLRNSTVSMSKGKYLLFLDDDTRIFQKDFLESALGFFIGSDADIIMPNAHSLYGIVHAKYDFLDQYSLTNRCCFYKRKVIEQMGGFNKDLNTYEDIELSIRLMIQGFKIFKAEELCYFHPPLYFNSMRKPLCIGQSIFQMKAHYSFLVWFLAYINSLRFLLYGLWPHRFNRQWLKISLGVLIYPLVRKQYYY